MNSNILNKLGLGNIDVGLILIIFFALLLVILIWLILQSISYKKIKNKYNKFMQGKNAKNLESDIFLLFEDNKLIKSILSKNEKDISSLFENMEYTFQKVGIVKYDAFHQMGGNLSFCLVLLNKNNDGFVLNSVHSTEGCYTYTKEIKAGICSISLGKEEEEALALAIND